MARPNCFMFERSLACRAFSRAWAKTGKRIAARIAIIAITTSSSINVKAPLLQGVNAREEAYRPDTVLGAVIESPFIISVVYVPTDAGILQAFNPPFHQNTLLDGRSQGYVHFYQHAPSFTPA